MPRGVWVPHGERFGDKRWKGGAPDGHPHQCKGKSRVTGLRCRRFALRGVDLCSWHQGRGKQKGTGHKRWLARLPVWYRKVLNKTLEDLVADAVGVNAAEQISLIDELALIRAAATRSIKLFGATMDLPESTGEEREKKNRLVEMARQTMTAHLDSVRVFCESAARVHAQGKDKFSVHNLKSVVDQITITAHQVFGSHPDLVKEFERRMSEKLTITDVEQGTTLTPDADVTAMDLTVPRENEDEQEET